MEISAVLLAGGESRRMGRDKATLEFRGRPLWQWQLDRLGKLPVKEVFLSARSDPAWRPAGVPFIADAEPSRGPLSGLAATLPRITTAHLLVFAIDLPFVSADYLRSLTEMIIDTRGAVPMRNGGAEPLVAIYPKDAQGEMEEALAGNDFSLQALVRKLVAADRLIPIPVAPSEADLFRNLNEPADLPGEE
jgi:molybdopterin-guanine dinucleotide biosynthesis protein A